MLFRSHYNKQLQTKNAAEARAEEQRLESKKKSEQFSAQLKEAAKPREIKIETEEEKAARSEAIAAEVESDLSAYSAQKKERREALDAEWKARIKENEEKRGPTPEQKEAQKQRELQKQQAREKRRAELKNAFPEWEDPALQKELKVQNILYPNKPVAELVTRTKERVALDQSNDRKFREMERRDSARQAINTAIVDSLTNNPITQTAAGVLSTGRYGVQTSAAAIAAAGANTASVVAPSVFTDTLAERSNQFLEASSLGVRENLTRIGGGIVATTGDRDGINHANELAKQREAVEAAYVSDADSTTKRVYKTASVAADVTLDPFGAASLAASAGKMTLGQAAKATVNAGKKLPSAVKSVGRQIATEVKSSPSLMSLAGDAWTDIKHMTNDFRYFDLKQGALRGSEKFATETLPTLAPAARRAGRETVNILTDSGRGGGGAAFRTGSGMGRSGVDMSLVPANPQTQAVTAKASISDNPFAGMRGGMGKKARQTSRKASKTVPVAEQEVVQVNQATAAAQQSEKMRRRRFLWGYELDHTVLDQAGRGGVDVLAEAGKDAGAKAATLTPSNVTGQVTARQEAVEALSVRNSYDAEWDEIIASNIQKLKEEGLLDEYEIAQVKNQLLELAGRGELVEKCIADLRALALLDEKTVKTAASTASNVTGQVTARQKAVAERLAEYASSDELAQALQSSNAFDIQSVKIQDTLKVRNVGENVKTRGANASYSPRNRSVNFTRKALKADSANASIDHELAHAMQHNTVGGMKKLKDGLTVYEKKLLDSLGDDINRFLSDIEGYDHLLAMIKNDPSVGSMYSSSRIRKEPIELFTSLVQASISPQFKKNKQAVEMLKKLMKFHGYAEGGLVYANNGALIEARQQGTDIVPAMLTPGEFVVNRQAAQQHMPLLQSINSGHMNHGGIVKYLAQGGAVSNKYHSPAYFPRDGGTMREYSEESIKTLEAFLKSLAGISAVGETIKSAANTMMNSASSYQQAAKEMPNSIMGSIDVRNENRFVGFTQGIDTLKNDIYQHTRMETKQMQRDAFSVFDRKSEGAWGNIE